MSQIAQSKQKPEIRSAALDPRAVCNLILDEGDRNQTAISNLILQKLLYFTHSLYLLQTKQPLVTGYFEAWTHGPVHPGAYAAFKVAGARPIGFRARREDPLTGKAESILNPTDPVVIQLVGRVTASYGAMDSRRLVDIGHAPGGPWHFVVNQGKASMAFGLRISDNVIIERFRFHKVTIGTDSIIGEPSEDAPFA
jgi:uncharacterized phage-associated protein